MSLSYTSAVSPRRLLLKNKTADSVATLARRLSENPHGALQCYIFDSADTGLGIKALLL